MRKGRRQANRRETASTNPVGDPLAPPKSEREQTQAASAPNSAETAKTQSDSAGASTFPIVGIGASAGGLAALEAFFAHMPSDSETGVAFVIVQHLDPDHKSILSELVRRCTRMRVFDVADGMALEPNCAYIIKPNRDLALSEGKLRLTEPAVRRGLRLPIDFFFRSLVQERGEQAIGIILSGTGTDGTLGLRAIKEAGGMAMVQEPQSAEYDGMPRSAIASGLADYVLPPRAMPEQLLAYLKRTSGLKPSPVTPVPPDVSGWISKVMTLLRSHTGHDLSNYRQNTVRRRVERRMAVNQSRRSGSTSDTCDRTRASWTCCSGSC
jgi:two-component system, chemotaxis family, CheB/CheR fusion protein